MVTIAKSKEYAMERKRRRKDLVDSNEAVARGDDGTETSSTPTEEQEKQSIMVVSMDPPEPPPNEPPYTQQEIRQIMKNIYKGRIMFVQKRTIHFLRAKIDPRWYYIVVGTKPYQAEAFFEMLDTTQIDPYLSFHVNFRLCGGKGGFGSLLKSFRVNKSTNQLMCRDLNGRRLASVEEEKKLRRWLERATDREKERVEKRRARYEKLKSAKPKHEFDDTEYIRVREEILERTEDACEEAFQRVREQKEKAELEKILKGSKEKKEESDEEEELPVDGEDPIECLFGGRGKMKRARANTEKGKDAKKAKKDYESSSSDSEDDIDPEQIQLLKEYISNKENTDGPSCSKSDKELPAKTKKTESPRKKQNEEKKAAEEKQQEEEHFEPIDPSKFATVEELEQIGANHLKFELQARGLKCGGTVHERAERLFSVKDLQPKNYPKNLLANGGKKGSK
ncbi:hypothetical protein WR25_00818 [Diploscapter pachys]|uniref:Uncharacterized protein n=1 Tax=Diploscapter pachys TaxID=2018661 RepID=A0A2A2JV18_9BILA|nr:hypothetical protein WR25_00818 [Diploscapter pachys]